MNDRFSLSSLGNFCRPDDRRMKMLAILITVFASLASAEAQEVSFAVQVVPGAGDPQGAVLMIPGLGSPGSVWSEAARALSERGFEIHIFTLAGFAGEPAVEGEFLPRVRRELISYARNLAGKPAVVGHSLGGTMALWLAASEPDLFGPVVAVDGVPFLPALQSPGATEQSVRQVAEQMRGMLEGMTQEAYEQQAAFTLSTMITDPEVARRVAEASKGSDPQVVAKAVHDLMTRDLRDDLAAIKSPVLMLAAGASAPTEEATEALLARYKDQVTAVPDCQVVMVKGARHFVMLDAPERFLELVCEHLGASCQASSKRG